MTFFASLHTRLFRHRWAVLAAVLCCWGALAWTGLSVRMDNSSSVFFPDTLPEARRMAEGMDMAPFSRLLFINLSLEREGEKERLVEAAETLVAALPPDLAERAGMLPDIQPAGLLALLPGLFDEEALEFARRKTSDDAIGPAILSVREALTGLWGSVAGPWLRADPLGLRDIVLRRVPSSVDLPVVDPTLGYPVSKDERNLLLIIRPFRSVHDVDAAVRLMDAIDAGLRRLDPDVHALVVGGHRHTAVNSSVIREDIQRILVWSVLGFILVYGLLVRSAGAFWLLLTPMLAVSLTMGGMTLFWPVLSGLAVGFAASVLGISEDYAVHMHFALRSGLSRTRVLDLLSMPLAQGLLLNLTGFAVLLFSAVPALRQMAAFALLTLIAGCLIALVFLPLCPGIATPVNRAPAMDRDPSTPVLWRTLCCAGCLIAVCGWLFASVRVDVSPRTLGAGMAEMEAAGRHIASVWGQQEEQLLVVRADTPDAVLGKARDLVAFLRKQAPESDVASLSDLLPPSGEAELNRERWRRFVSAEGERIARAVREAGGRWGFTDAAFAPFAAVLRAEPVSLTPEGLEAVGFGDLVHTFLNVGPRGAQGLVLTREPVDIGMLPESLRDSVVSLSSERLEAMMGTLFSQERTLVPIVLLLCAGLLLLCFRNVPRTLLALIPPLCSVGGILGWLFLSASPLTLAGLAALPLVLGLAVDHGIMVTHELEHGINLGIQRAIWVSSLTACTSMGMLALAAHPALRDIGRIIFLGLLIEVPASLWLLPALCRKEKA